MTAISLNLPDDLAEASGEFARALQLSRAEDTRRAIKRMNREMQAQLRARRLAEASRKVRDESMQVNAEFAAFEQDLRVHIRASGRLRRRSDLMIDQLRAIDNRRLIQGPLAQLPPALMRQVSEALREVLDLNPEG